MQPTPLPEKVALLDSKTLGSRIRLARENLRLSQEELAIAVSKDQHAISQYENGSRKLSVVDLPAFADALKVPLVYFFEGETILEDFDATILDLLHRLPTVEAKQAAINLLRALHEALQPYYGQ